ncbi:MAG: 4Fe-4S cluster-binding domain-containing protein [Clostridium sp.]
MKAVVNRIIPFSSVDGPGNRTAIFLQGCNIDCKYCHNPETRKLCVQCGTCEEQCPAGALSLGADGKVTFDPAKPVCSVIPASMSVPHDSSPRTCEMTPEEVYARVKSRFLLSGVSAYPAENVCSGRSF